VKAIAASRVVAADFLRAPAGIGTINRDAAIVPPFLAASGMALRKICRLTVSCLITNPTQDGETAVDALGADRSYWLCSPY
jgi:hypothetical protein